MFRVISCQILIGWFSADTRPADDDPTLADSFVSKMSERRFLVLSDQSDWMRSSLMSPEMENRTNSPGERKGPSVSVFGATLVSAVLKSTGDDGEHEHPTHLHHLTSDEETLRCSPL